MKIKDSTKDELKQARREVIGEAEVLSELGKHPVIPHLFGVCSEEAPFYLVLQYNAVEGCSIILSKAVTTGLVACPANALRLLNKFVKSCCFFTPRVICTMILKATMLHWMVQTITRSLLTLAKAGKFRRQDF